MKSEKITMWNEEGISFLRTDKADGSTYTQRISEARAEAILSALRAVGQLENWVKFKSVQIVDL
jgi:hypothetical protein